MSSVLFALANILDIILNIYFWIVFIAVILSWIPVYPSHPTVRTILRFLRQATEPVFTFFRRTFRLHRYTSPLDFTPIAVILAIFFLRLFLVQSIRDLAIANNPAQLLTFISANFLLALCYTLYSLLNMYFWIVIVAFIFSWIPLDPYHPLAQALLLFLRNVTEPVFRFFRRTLRLHQYISSFDFTPLVVIASIYLLQTILLRVIIPGILALHS